MLIEGAEVWVGVQSMHRSEDGGIAERLQHPCPTFFRTGMPSVSSTDSDFKPVWRRYICGLPSSNLAFQAYTVRGWEGRDPDSWHGCGQSICPYLQPILRVLLMWGRSPGKVGVCQGGMRQVLMPASGMHDSQGSSTTTTRDDESVAVSP